MSVEISLIKDAKLREIASSKDVDKNEDKKLSRDEYSVFAQKATAQGATYEEVSNALNLNALERWWFDVDKVSTDGKDDGKLSAGEIAEYSAKGFVGGIVKSIAKNPITTAVTIGLGAAATFATGGAAIPLLVGLGAGASAIAVGTNIYNYAKSDNDTDAKMALEGAGTATAGLALACAGVKSANKAGAKAGIKGLEGLENASWGKNVTAMFKSTPEILKVNKNQFASFLKNVTYESYISEGANVSRKLISDVDRQAYNAKKRIIDYANERNRKLTPEEIEEIRLINSKRNEFVETLNAKAKEMGSDVTIKRGTFSSNWNPDNYYLKAKNQTFSSDETWSGGLWGNQEYPWSKPDPGDITLDNMLKAIKGFKTDVLTRKARYEVSHPNFYSGMGEGPDGIIAKISGYRLMRQQQAEIKNCAEFLGIDPTEALGINKQGYQDWVNAYNGIKSSNNQYLK